MQTDSPPTAQDYELFEDLKVRIHTVVAELDDFVEITDWTQSSAEEFQIDSDFGGSSVKFKEKECGSDLTLLARCL